MVSMSSDGIGSFCGATGRIWGLDGCSKSLSMILNHRRCLSLEQVVFGLWHRNILFMNSDGR